MRRVWTEEMDALVRRQYPTAHLENLAFRLGVTKVALKTRARKLGLKREVNLNRPWSKRQISYLKKHYADTPINVLVEKTKHGIPSVYAKAQALGLYKSKEFLASLGRKLSETEGARRNRWVKGHVSFNKGKRIEEFMSAEGMEMSKKHWFKPGNTPHNHRAVGTERTHADGYVYLKTEDGCVPKHRYIWERIHGKIPEGYTVAFRDGDRQHCEIENLELVSKAGIMIRTISRETTEARRSRMEKITAARNKSISRDKARLHFGLEPLGKLVKRW